jgi:uncharacterized membrane protein
MDLHPLIVHFPVALLTIYAVLELIRFKKVLAKPYWFFVKAMFVIFGALGAAAAYLTGPDALARSPLGQMHQNFATITLSIFAVIGFAYLLEWKKPNRYSGFVLRPYIIIPLALLGLVAVVITGGLGGALVYGTNFDPFMAPIFKFLGVY